MLEQLNDKFAAEYSKLESNYNKLSSAHELRGLQLQVDKLYFEKLKASGAVPEQNRSQVNSAPTGAQMLALLSYPIYGAVYNALGSLVGGPKLAGLLVLALKTVSNVVPAVGNAFRSSMFINGFINYALLQAIVFGFSDFAAQLNNPVATFIAPILAIILYIRFIN
jgi:hypothetical protein